MTYIEFFLADFLGIYVGRKEGHKILGADGSFVGFRKEVKQIFFFWRESKQPRSNKFWDRKIITGK